MWGIIPQQFAMGGNYLHFLKTPGHRWIAPFIIHKRATLSRIQLNSNHRRQLFLLLPVTKNCGLLPFVSLPSLFPSSPSFPALIPFPFLPFPSPPSLSVDPFLVPGGPGVLENFELTKPISKRSVA
jgi:hypothetical protein